PNFHADALALVFLESRELRVDFVAAGGERAHEERAVRPRDDLAEHAGRFVLGDDVDPRQHGVLRVDDPPAQLAGALLRVSRSGGEEGYKDSDGGNRHDSMHEPLRSKPRPVPQILWEPNEITTSFLWRLCRAAGLRVASCARLVDRCRRPTSGSSRAEGKNIRIRIVRNRTSPYNIFRSSTSRRSERNIPVLLRRVLVAFAVQVLERGNQLPAGLARLDHFVDEAAARRDVGVGEFGAELGNLLPADGRGVGRGVELALVKN